MTDNKIKLHIGCGTVYLENYVNIDANPDGLAGAFPDIVLNNKTTVNNYYKTDFNERPKFVVADVQATLFDVCDILGRSSGGFTSEICMFHVLEHIPKYDVDEAIDKINFILEPNGTFRVAVPDFDAISIEYAEKLKNGITEQEKEWYYRYVYGTQKNKWSHHYCGYNKYVLEKLLKCHGFNNFESLPNQNFYPAVHLLAHKI